MSAARFPIEAGHCLTFARALGEADDAYGGVLGVAASGDVYAPPTFVEAAAQFDPEAKFRPRAGQRWLGSGRDASGLDATERPAPGGMHAEQHFTYHRPLRVGDVLRSAVVETASWSKASRDGSLLYFRQTVSEFTDGAGLPVVEARRVIVAREPADDVPEQASSRPTVPSSLRPVVDAGKHRRSMILTDDLTRTQIVQYAGASGDYNPIHTDERFATEVAGYPTVMAHGMLVMGMAARIVTDWFGVAALNQLSARFKAPVWPGDRLEAVAEVSQFGHLHLTGGDRPCAAVTIDVRRHDGVSVLSGAATVLVDAETGQSLEAATHG